MGDIAIADGVKLTREDVHAVAREELQNLGDEYSDELHANWEKAYQYYRGDPRGDEQRGRSKIQSSDVSDAIEWILPVLVKSFVETPDVVRFDPQGPEDEEQANLESDYCHRAFMKKCNGFLVLYEFLKDALMLKNGVTFTCWNKEVKQFAEPFSDLTEEELTLLLQPSDGSRVELEGPVEVDERPAIDPVTGEQLTVPLTGEPVLIKYHSGRTRRYTEHGRPEIEVCVPEQFKPSKTQFSVDLSKARFAAYAMVKSAAEMVAAGYDPKVIEEVPGVETTRGVDDEVRRARQDVENDDNDRMTQTAASMVDRSQRLITVNRCYMPLDANGDGYEEYYLIVLGGDDGEVLIDYYEVPECPFDSASPFIAAHKFWGYSMFDKLKEIQDLKTKFLRMIADNTDLLNDPEKMVIPGMMRMEDAMVKQVGGLKRVEDQSAYTELPPPQVGPQAFQILEWADKMRGERVGVDPDAASATKVFPDEAMNGAFERLMTAKEEVVNLIIRVMAEIWFRPVMLKLRRLTMTHMRREEVVKLRSKWVTVDPRNWTERLDTTVVVGLGTGDRLKKMMGLEKVAAMQAQEMAAGMNGTTVTNSKRVNVYSDFVRSAGLGDPDEYFLDPVRTEAEIQQMQASGQAPSPEAFEAFIARQRQAAQAEAAQQGAQQAPGPDPQTLLAIEDKKGQTAVQLKQMDIAAKGQDTAAQAAQDQQKAQLDALLERTELLMKDRQHNEEMRLQWAQLFEKFEMDAASAVTKAEQVAQKQTTGDNGGAA